MNNMRYNHKRLDLAGEERQRLAQRYQQGEALSALADQYGFSEQQLRRLIQRERYATIMSLALDHIPNPDFADPKCAQEILAPPPEVKRPTARKSAPKGLPSYLASLYEVPLLTAAEEKHLFRQFNYLKYRASELRDALDPRRPSLRRMDEIEELHRRAVQAKNQIVRANLRLVVSIAKRYASDHEDVFDLTSEGNMSLMRAVEKFDFARGNRLSTYATWAITRNFARAYHNRISQATRFRTGQEEFVDIADSRRDPHVEESAQRVHEADVSKILDCLSEREREIVAKRFGLARVQPPLTLKEIGAEMGVSKERVRQIEKVALDKLREAAALARIEYTAA